MVGMNQIRTAGRQAYKVGNAQFLFANPHIAAIHERLGMNPQRGYFVLRAAPLGPCEPMVVASAIAFFPAIMVAKIVGRSREDVPPEAVLDVAIPLLTRAAESVFGDGPDVVRLAALYETAAESAPLEGRAMATAWSTVAWPDVPAARLLGAATVLREHRGDSHIMGLAAVGLRPMHGVLLDEMRRGGDPVAFAAGKGYRSEEITPAMEQLDEMGAFDGDRHLMLWEAAEEATDHASAAPWQAIGDDIDECIATAGRVIEHAAWG